MEQLNLAKPFYVITIKRVSEKMVNEDTYQRIADTGNKIDRGAMYGYVPHTTIERDNVEVFNQCVDELDLAKVIKAVNNIE